MASKTTPASIPPRIHEVPNDPFHLVFIICLVLGCGTLLSYNVLVSCATYFNYQFYEHPNIMFIIVPVFSIPNLLFIILMIPFGDRFSWTLKILGCFITVGILVLFIPLLVSSNSNTFNLTQDKAYHIFLFIVAAIGSASAILQCSIVAFCGLLPMRYLQTVLGGQAVSGILVCVIRIFSKLFLPLTPQGIEQSGLIYFMISAAISIICAISFYWSKHSAFVQHHVNDNIKLKYKRKLKRTASSQSSSCSNDSISHHNQIDNEWSGSDTQESSINYPILPTSTVNMQINTRINGSLFGAEIHKDTDIKATAFPVLVRCDTPHTLAAFVNVDLYDDVPHEDDMSISVVDEDDILTPLQNSPYITNIDMKSYGSINQFIDTDHDESSSHSLREKQMNLYTFESQKKVIALKDKEDERRDGVKMIKQRDRVDQIPKYYVKHHRFNFRKYVHVFWNIRYLVLSIWISMFVTFLWFPGIVANIKSSFEVINTDGEWMAIIMITEFNVVDYIGRQFLSSYTPSWLKEHNLWTCGLLRIVTYPAFILFYRGYVVNDYMLHIVMIISALSNGWVASLSFMWFPRNIDKHQQEIAASIMTLGLIMGILTGSFVALVIQPYL